MSEEEHERTNRWMDGLMGEIEESLSGMMQWALMTHEMYTSLVEAGFTEEQALRLVSNMMRGTSDG